MTRHGSRFGLVLFAVLALVVAQLPAGPAQAAVGGRPDIAWTGGGTMGVQGVAVSPEGRRWRPAPRTTR